MSPILIVILILMALVFLVAVTWVALSTFFDLSDRRYISPASAGRRVTEPACGRCGYPARGLGSLDCPECGADLRDVGIVTPALVHAFGGGAAGCGLPLAWTVGLIAAGTLCNGLIAPRLPSQWLQGGWYEFLVVVFLFCFWIVGLVFFSVKPKQNTKNNRTHPLTSTEQTLS